MLGKKETAKNPELGSIEKKILDGKERDVSGGELVAYVLGNCSSGDPSVAIAEDLLSYFGGWEGLFRAKRVELEEFNQLGLRQIDMIFTLGKLEKIMKTIEN